MCHFILSLAGHLADAPLPDLRSRICGEHLPQGQCRAGPDASWPRTVLSAEPPPAQVENRAFATSIGPEMISLKLEMIDLMHGPKRRNKLVFKINALRVFDLDFFFKQMESPVYIFFYMLHFSMINYFYLNSLNY